jgi:putative SOS response-associated peptidase YedK
MPVIFDRLSAKQWLDPNFGPNEAILAAVLAPYPPALMEAHDVSPLVNKPENEMSECINTAEVWITLPSWKGHGVHGLAPAL